MLKSFPKLTLTVLAAALVSSNAFADINTSLATVCDKVENQPKAQTVSEADQAKQAYQSRLASFYANASCNGKQLIQIAQLNSESKSGMLVDRKALD